MLKKLYKNGFVWLVLALAMQLFVGGNLNFVLAPWIALPLFLKFTRGQKSIGLVWLGFPFFALVTGISMKGIVPIRFPFYPIFIASISMLIYSGFLIDRWIVRQRGMLSLMVFPTFLVALEGLVSLGPYGTWNSLAYTQSDNLCLIQLASVTGIWGITFIIGLTASVLCRAWEDGFKNKSSWRWLGVVMVILLIVHVFGFTRITSYANNAEVKVGAYSIVMPAGGGLRDIALQFIAKDSPRDKADLYRSATLVAQSELISKTAQLARQASVVFWTEANAIVFENDEAQFLANLSTIAKEKQVIIFASLAVIQFGKNKMSNKVVIINPEQGIIGEYVKSIIPPGEPSQKGPGILKHTVTPFGKLSVAICFDMDFPGLILQAGRASVDVLLVPALDWKEIGTIHSNMAKFRGIENGISIMRHAADGISLATNPVGQILAKSDYFASDDHVFISGLPTARIETIYSRFGNWFLYLIIAFVIFGLLRKWFSSINFT